MTARDVYILLAEWLVAPLLRPFKPLKLWYHRRRVRWGAREMNLRRLRKTINVLALLLVASHARAQTPVPDSLIGTVLSRAVIPAAWNPGQPGIYCLVWTAQKPNRPHLLVVIDAEPADLEKRPICPDPDGGFFPFWIDGPTCPPGNKSPFPERDFVIIRCADGISRYNTERPPLPKKAQ